MFSKILLGVVLCMGITFAGFYQFIHKPLLGQVAQQQVLLAAQELREQEQVKTIEALQNNLQKTSEALNVMSSRNAEIEAESKRYLAIFARHNLSRLAAAKPTLIETRINRGTKDVFDSIENDTAVIDNTDK